MAFGYQESNYEVVAAHSRPVKSNNDNKYWKIELREKEPVSEEWASEMEALKQMWSANGVEAHDDKIIRRYISLDLMSSEHKRLNNTLLVYQDADALEADWQAISSGKPMVLDEMGFYERIESLSTGYTKDGWIRMY